MSVIRHSPWVSFAFSCAHLGLAAAHAGSREHLVCRLARAARVPSESLSWDMDITPNILMYTTPAIYWSCLNIPPTAHIG